MGVDEDASSGPPTFFVIGASKSGTTALYEYLAAHPQVAMTRPKEPHVLIGGAGRPRREEYERLLDPAPARGEASTGYSMRPHHPEVVENMATLVPAARLVYLVRDPVERAVAHYSQATIAGRETRPIEAAIDLDDPACRYVAASRYATQLEAYLERFERSALLIVETRELRNNRARTMRRIYEHIAVDSGFLPSDLEREHNVRGVANVPLPDVGRRLKGSPLGSAYRRLLPRSARRRITPHAGRWLGGKVTPHEPSQSLLDSLRLALRPEADRLREHAGTSFPDWSV